MTADDRWCLYCTHMSNLAACGGPERKLCQYPERWGEAPANAPTVWRSVTEGAAPPVFPDHCQQHADVAVPGNCGDCADTRKANQARPVLSLVSNRPDWCGECDEWTRLRDYDGTPYRCPTCHPLAKEAS